MPAFTMDQPWWALGRQFRIRDGDGNLRYRVRSKLLTFMKSSVLEDASGREVAAIRQPVFVLDRLSTITAEGRTVATVKQLLDRKPQGQTYSVDVEAGRVLSISETRYKEKYVVREGARTLATIVRGVGYSVATGDADEVLLLSIAVAIDQWDGNYTEST